MVSMLPQYLWRCPHYLWWCPCCLNTCGGVHVTCDGVPAMVSMLPQYLWRCTCDGVHATSIHVAVSTFPMVVSVLQASTATCQPTGRRHWCRSATTCPSQPPSACSSAIYLPVSLSAQGPQREGGGFLMSPTCLESQGCQLDPTFLYRLSCSSGLKAIN